MSYNKKRKNAPPAAVFILITAVLAGTGTFLAVRGHRAAEPEKTDYIPAAQISLVTAERETEPMLPVSETPAASEAAEEDRTDEEEHSRPYKSGKTVEFDTEQVTAANSLLINADTYEILARHNSYQRIYPASMTKVMTVLVAAENLKESDMDKTFKMTYELLHPLVMDNASRAGFEVDEEVTVRDMLYALILPSGADGAVGLAEYIAGSEEKFVELMNRKAEEMGLETTHFTNVAGLHSTEHYTTCIEMAMIMREAMKNPLCREILSTYTYTTSQTEQHPDGIVLYSTMFGRMYGNEVEGVNILAGKTGYTDEARHCLVSYAEKGNKNYILVLAKENDRWGAIYSTFHAYEQYLR